MKMSLATLAVLNVLLERLGKPTYGLDIMRTAQLASGTVYPILARLEAGGLVSGSWEAAASVTGRPARRYYVLTGSGERVAREALATARARIAPSFRPSPGGALA